MGHSVIVLLNLTWPHYLQHSFFEHHFNLYWSMAYVFWPETCRFSNTFMHYHIIFKDYPIKVQHLFCNLMAHFAMQLICYHTIFQCNGPIPAAYWCNLILKDT